MQQQNRRRVRGTHESKENEEGAASRQNSWHGGHAWLAAGDCIKGTSTCKRCAHKRKAVCGSAGEGMDTARDSRLVADRGRRWKNCLLGGIRLRGPGRARARMA